MSDNLPVQSRAGLPSELNGKRRLPALASPVAEEGAGFDWRRAWSAVKRHKWIVLACIVLGTAGGVAAFQFVPLKYVAQATVWVETPPGRDDRGPIQQGQLLASIGWVDLMRSYTVLDEAIRRERLYLKPANAADAPFFRDFELDTRFALGNYKISVSASGDRVTLESKEGAVIEQVSPGDSIGYALGFRFAPPAGRLWAGRAVEFAVLNPRDVARRLGQQLRPNIDKNGNFLSVSLEGPDPQQTTNTLNGVLDRFVEVAADLKRQKVTELASILNEQLRNGETNLRNAEVALETFRIQTITLPTEASTPMVPGLELTRDPVFDNFFDMQVTREQLRRDREAIDRVLRDVAQGTLDASSLEAIESVRASSDLKQALTDLTSKRAELRALRSRYTEDYPDVRRLREQVEQLETEAIPVMASALRDQLAARGADLGAQITEASRELQQIPPRVIQEARLRRDVAIANDLYVNLQSRYEEARLAEASTVADIRILDPAVVPQRPVRDMGMQMLLLGILGGIGLGIAAAIALDKLDRRVRYPAQVTDELGLTILGAVPRLKAGRGTGAMGTGAVIEAMRGIRMGLKHAHGAAGPVVVTVTSPGSGDGKSFVSSNLALSFADGGSRTLLIDGDNRRGALHRVMSLKRRSGLTDALVQQLSARDVIQQSAFARLDFIGCGTRLPGAPELLASSELARFVAELRGEYDVIIFDSPPLGAGIDAYAIGTVTGNVMVVLRTGATDKAFAEAKLQGLDRLPIRLMGAVLNDVREGDSHGYGYYSYYMPGYEYMEEQEDDKATQPLLNRAG